MGWRENSGEGGWTMLLLFWRVSLAALRSPGSVTMSCSLARNSPLKRLERPGRTAAWPFILSPNTANREPLT